LFHNAVLYISIDALSLKQFSLITGVNQTLIAKMFVLVAKSSNKELTISLRLFNS